MKLTMNTKKLLITMLLILAVNTNSAKKTNNELSLQSESSTTVFEFLQNFDKFKMLNNFRNDTASPSQAAPSSPVPPQSSANTTNQTTTSQYIKNLNDPSVQLQDWLSISSNAFMNPSKFPVMRLENGDNIELKFGAQHDRMNEKFSIAQNEGSENEYNFWFKIRGGYMYYFATKDDINILGSILVQRAENTNIHNKHANENITNSCFQVYDNANDMYLICAMTQDIKFNWLCSLQSFLKTDIDPFCFPAQPTQSLVKVDNANAVEVKKITQPVIIIPMSSRKCNNNADYKNKGKDWECICSEGLSQSPIDLPSKDSANLSSLRPMFQYTTVNAKALESTVDGLLTAGEYMKIRYDRGAIRIHHPNMGKIVTDDGGVYIAEEIIFHTPSEHTINGERLDMEMQVIHYGKSKGDIAKQVVLSFLFKAKPGVYNKFLDKLDFFNLPNPTDVFRDITNDFFIPSVFSTPDEEDIQSLQPFSFYTYEGSLTAPPCTERTLHYVIADPIQLSNTVISLFKEALKAPDMMTDKGDYIMSSDEDKENYRAIQPLNGRIVYIFDHIKFNCPEFKKARPIQPKGHYEKRQIDVTQYIYVNGEQPSGIPNSFVVPENEAKGVDSAIPGDDENNQNKADS
jgi:carbonic anhydrase